MTAAWIAFSGKAGTKFLSVDTMRCSSHPRQSKIENWFACCRSLRDLSIWHDLANSIFHSLSQPLKPQENGWLEVPYFKDTPQKDRELLAQFLLGLRCDLADGDFLKEHFFTVDESKFAGNTHHYWLRFGLTADPRLAVEKMIRKLLLQRLW